MSMNITRRPTRQLVLAALALAGLALVAGCAASSTGASQSASTSAAHDAADVAFATDMIPHHAQAVEMADMALAAAVDPEVKALAQAIKGAQDPEITTMTGWLTEWKAPVPQTGMGHAMSGDASTGMGMMSDSDMAALGQTSGDDFDRLWVDMMLRHHNGAIDMANIEIKKGKFPDARALAQQIITSQTAEMTRMTAMAQRLN